MPETDKYAELMRELRQRCVATQRRERNSSNLLVEIAPCGICEYCRPAAAIISLQARVRELEKVIQDGLCDESTEPFCEWCISARNALREEQRG